MHSVYRKLLESACMSCVIDVVGWQDVLTRLDPNQPMYGWINIGVISNHVPIAHQSWRGRLRRAAAALRAQDDPVLEFYNRSDLAAFMRALDEAATVAFPEGAAE